MSHEIARSIAHHTLYAPSTTLKDIDPSLTPGWSGTRKKADKELSAIGKELSNLQERLFARGRHGDPRSILLILQGMDSSGKGGIVRHVIGAVDPQGVAHQSFGKPTPEELQHDFLWRITKALPHPGFIGVFDRSHYEDVLVARVNDLAPDAEIERRYNAINNFEHELTTSGVTVIKVLLHISRDEQRARLEDRLNRPDKYWKYHPSDVDERLKWPAYEEAFQVMLDRTHTEAAPWHIVPANSKRYARLAVSELLLNALVSFNLQWPEATFDINLERARLANS